MPSAAELLIHEWIKLYKQWPRITVVVTIATVGVGGIAIYLTEQHNREVRETARLQNMNYAKQVQALDDTRANLTALIEFVDSEKRQLELSQQALQSIKAEHERMKPLIESDRKAIDALFAAQEARNQAAQSIERWIGFGLGVIASLIASLLWAVFTYALGRNKV